MMQPPGELIELLHRYDEDVRAVVLGLRQVVLEEMAPCHEYIFTMRGRVMLLYGPTSRVIEDCVCMIGAYRKHANLQFTDGLDLTDAHGVLEGSGKRMRHLKIRAISDLGRPEIREFLRQARQNAGMTRRASPADDEVVTRIKPARSASKT